MNKFLFVLVAFLFAMATSFAASPQVKSVKGVVMSADDNGPLPGAAVMVKGTQIGTTTDINGHFVLNNLPDGAHTLVISFLGMKTEEVSVKEEVNVTLYTVSNSMDEVVVVAFGKQKREAFTGSATVIDSKTITERQVSSPLAALSGKVAGLQMVEDNSPTGEPSMLVRGIGSINSSIDPLVVLDGLPYNGYYSDINPADVESISVLKDAASTALYGARGANGVILITTKNAKMGKSVITVDMKWGDNGNGNVDYDCIDGVGEYYNTHYRALYNYYVRSKGEDGGTATRHANEALTGPSAGGGLGFSVYNVPDGQYLFGTNGLMNPNATLGNVVTNNGKQYLLTPDDWRKAGIRHGLRQEYTVTVNGGSETMQTYASIGYMKNEGLTFGSEYERYSGRFKADYQARPWLKIGANMSYTHNESNSMSSAFGTAWSASPIYPLYVRDAEGNILTDENGKVYDWGNGEYTGVIRPANKNSNDLQSDRLDFYLNNSNAFGLQGYGEVSFLKDFRVTANISVYDTENRMSIGSNPFYGYLKATGGALSTYHYRTYALNAQQLINWNHQFGLHNASLLLGHEYSRDNSTSLSADKTNFFDYWGHRELNGLIKDGSMAGKSSVYNVEGFFFRAQYDYDSKYFLSGSYRRDGSSRFHPAHRWGNFWSVGGAWIITKENWNLPRWANMLKLKVSYGQQGNDGIADYCYDDYYTIEQSDGQPALKFTTKGNPKITWETNSNLNAGLEFEVVKSRIRGSVEYYDRKTTDLLAWFTVPRSIGYSGYYDNVGDMVNRGVEITLDADPILSKNVKWSLNFNISHNKNKITYIPLENQDLARGIRGYQGGWHLWCEEMPINTWYMPRYAGVAEDGQSQWYVQGEDGELSTTTDYSSADYFTCGDPNPDWFGGFGTTISAYGFDLNANFTYSIGGKAMDYGYQSLMAAPSPDVVGGRFHRDVLKAWSEENKGSNIPRWQYNDINCASTSDRFLVDASHLTFKSVSLGYTLPKKWVNAMMLSSVRVYAVCDNVYYWTKRNGFDPRNAGGFDGETVTGGYAPMRTISGGISVKF